MKLSKTLKWIPVALIMMAAPLFSGTAAHAGTPRQTFEVTFAFKTDAAAETIYSDLKTTARKACMRASGHSAILTHYAQRACKSEIVYKGVIAIGREDLYRLHFGRSPTVSVAQR